MTDPTNVSIDEYNKILMDRVSWDISQLNIASSYLYCKICECVQNECIAHRYPDSWCKEYVKGKPNLPYHMGSSWGGGWFGDWFDFNGSHAYLYMLNVWNSSLM